MSHSLQNIARRLSLQYLNLPSSVLPATPTTLFFEVHNLRRCLPPVALLKASLVFPRIYASIFVKPLPTAYQQPSQNMQAITPPFESRTMEARNCHARHQRWILYHAALTGHLDLLQKLTDEYSFDFKQLNKQFAIQNATKGCHKSVTYLLLEFAKQEILQVWIYRSLSDWLLRMKCPDNTATSWPWGYCLG